ncbi:MAG TPA: B12-binding domain-containing protein [Roseiflexaceae bacterium]|nr:B12-binding domain-containing protein [Roseiflexaceae bacterium]
MAHPPSLGHLSTAPIFNTKAVARETGVPPDTFRAWERRYGVPRPQRTPGGHRLYSERDMAIIRWLRERTEEGMNISHAVMLLASALEEAPQPFGNGESRALGRMAGELAGALTSFDAAAAERIVGEAFAIHPFERVLLDLIQPAMVEVGDRWQRGEINVAAEHYATEFVRRKLAGLLNVFERTASRETIVVGCAPQELHDLGALFGSLFLMRRGWRVLYLGAQVPLADLLEAVQLVRPDLVCLSASTAETAGLLREVALELQRRFPQQRLGYGGRIFNASPELRETMPGVFLGHDARELAESVAALLARGAPASGEGGAGRAGPL